MLTAGLSPATLNPAAAPPPKDPLWTWWNVRCEDKMAADFSQRAELRVFHMMFSRRQNPTALGRIFLGQLKTWSHLLIEIFGILIDPVSPAVLQSQITYPSSGIRREHILEAACDGPLPSWFLAAAAANEFC